MMIASPNALPSTLSRAGCFDSLIMRSRWDSPRDYENAPMRAAESLSLMGKEGRAALKELRDKNLLRDREALSFTTWFLNKK
jgi:hypothetical protein